MASLGYIELIFIRQSHIIDVLIRWMTDIKHQLFLENYAVKKYNAYIFYFEAK